MIRPCCEAILLISLLFPCCVLAQEGDVKADVAISIQQDQDIWAGQQVTLYLDLKTTGFSFSDSYFNLPEIAGAFLMQLDTTTVKVTESVNGETWQVIRYPIALYPQSAGQLEIPPIAVRFRTSAAFGSTSVPFEFRTKPLHLSVKSPAGVKDGELLVTTSSFELDYQWQPEITTAHTGDAYTLTVTRRARDISAMLLPPLPVFRTPGLAAYPQTPELNDKTSRGDLTGERIDRIIWVLEKAGTYDIPGIRFQWWDPGSNELKQQVVPGLNLEIAPALANKYQAGASKLSERSGRNGLWLLAGVLTVLATLFLGLRLSRNARSRTPGASPDSEKTAFSRLQQACTSNDVAAAYSALHAWLKWSSPRLSPGSRALTLTEFAEIHGNEALRTHFRQLQEMLVTANNNWQGGELLSALHGIRRKISSQKAVKAKIHLAPLNP